MTPLPQSAAAKALHARAERDNLFIKIPGTPEGLPAITEAIAAGVPVNVTLLFDAQQYRAAADAYMTGIERRLVAGEDPAVTSVASVFMSRWDAAIAGEVPDELKNRLALAVGGVTYRSLPGTAGLGPLAGAPGQGCEAAATVVGLHEREGPRGTRHDVRERPGGARHGQHRCRIRPSRRSMTTGCSEVSWTPTVADAIEVLERFRRCRGGCGSPRPQTPAGRCRRRSSSPGRR